MKIRTLIVDDEPLARESLRLLAKEEPDVEIVGVLGGGREAVTAINAVKPDLVLLDVQMPDLDGFGVFEQLNGHMPAVIFVTASDRHAIKAFEVHALDFVLKPYTRDRFRAALTRMRKQIQSRKTDDVQEKLGALLKDLHADPARPTRLAVKADGRIVFVRFDDIDWVESADNYVKVHSGAEAHMLRETLASLEEKLPPDDFLRISRSVIVNIHRIKELHPMFHGEYTVMLRGGAQLTLTRGYRGKLQELGVA